MRVDQLRGRQFTQDRDGYWYPSESPSSSLTDVAVALGYLHSMEYLSACCYNPEEVKARIRTMAEEYVCRGQE